MNFDIIGDIHGQADKLRALLKRLGYVERNGAMRHPERTAIFVGDFIDRGPRQMDTLLIVRAMMDAGSALAVMGNHEFNAVAWFMRDPEHDEAYLRTRHGERGARNRHQHAAFLAEVEHTPHVHAEVIDWFLTLPLWLDLPELRVVHACWHPEFIAELEPHLKPGRLLDEAMMIKASRRGSNEYRQVETLLKGTEVKLPPGCAFEDKSGITRREARTRWWDAQAVTYRDAALVPPEDKAQLPDAEIPATARIGGYAGDKPVFIGHYWMTGCPEVLSSKVACVDYSAGKGGPLVAYRWGGEEVLSSGNFVVAEAG
ncbi:metallophosphoesterase [Caballeronia sp. LZ035]|uniref:metallophosphoesterase n=1 Tax=Caballeronia sp. LZ035 TaxID=3038568 RepID=UPI0028642DE4|nr:metallophosphoesterase [Caballeronia sp. LZ035]MDR5760700.1 metallophosphoesterase [Caballeronia sp. LZ035]